MAKVTRSATRSVYIASAPPMSGSMTVWHLRDFLEALDAEGIPDSETLVAHHATDTRHFTGVSLRHTTDLTTDPAEEAP